jgi:hypothetical protein
VLALALRILAATGCAQAMAQPPAATATLATLTSTAALQPSAALKPSTLPVPAPVQAERPRAAQAARARRASAQRVQLKDMRLPPPPSALERFGGEHAKRALRVANGVPAGRVALRPMFWMTRDHSGAMVALGGRF